MTDREKLIDLIINAKRTDPETGSFTEYLADFLLGYGVKLPDDRPVSRERVEKVWRGCKYCDEEWGTCNPITNRFTMPPRGGIRFCPMCGRPLTDEAVEMVMERMDELQNEIG